MQNNTDAKRLAAALHEVGVSPADENEHTIQRLIHYVGLSLAMQELNARYETSLQLGDWIVYSSMEEGFWSEEVGWVTDPNAATGYSLSQRMATDALPNTDAQYMTYLDAVEATTVL